MLTLALRKPLEKRIQASAKKAGRSPQEVAIEPMAEGIEDYEDALIGLDRLKGDDGTRIPLADMIKDLEELEAKERAAEPAAE